MVDKRFLFSLAYIKNTLYICTPKMVVVAQLVRALDCDSRGRRFETDHPPKK